MSVIFNRTVNLPYVQTVTLTWTEQTRDDRGRVTRTDTCTLDLKDRAEKMIDLMIHPVVALRRHSNSHAQIFSI